MGLVGDGPFLGEGPGPAARLPVAEKQIDVLNDAPLLVVGLLEEKTVVLDGRARVLGDCRAGEAEQQPEGNDTHAPGG